MDRQEPEKKLDWILSELFEELLQLGCSNAHIFAVHLCISEAIVSAEKKNKSDADE